MKKLLRIESYIIFGILLILSVYFYKERIFFIDSSFQFFKILNFEKINIEAYRFSAIITQLPILFLIKTGISDSVTYLSIVYSLSFTALYFSLFIIIDKGLKDRAAATALLCVLIISISESFFHAVTETHQAVIFIIALYAFYKYQFRIRFLNYILPIVFIALSIYAHLVAAVFIPFVFIFHHIHNNKKINTKLVVSLSATFILLLIKLLFFRATGYAQSFIDNLTSIKQALSVFTNSHNFIFLSDYFFNTFFIHLFIFAFNIIFLLKHKRKYELIFVAVYSVFALLVLLLVYSSSEPNIMKERAFMPMGIVLCIPYFAYLFNEIKIKKWIYILTILFILFSSVRIYYTGIRLSKETQKIENLISYADTNYNGDKFIIKSKLLKDEFRLKRMWSLAFETLLLSSTKDPQNQITVFKISKNEKRNLTKTPNVFLGSHFWLFWPNAKMNKRFFNLKSKYYTELQ